MIPCELKLRICELLAPTRDYALLDPLREASREWSEIANGYQWKNFTFSCKLPDADCKVSIRCYGAPGIDTLETMSIEQRHSLFLSIGHDFVKTLFVSGDLTRSEVLQECCCPNLRSLNLGLYAETLCALSRFIGKNTTIRKLTIHNPIDCTPNDSLSGIPLIDSITPVLDNLTSLHLKSIFFDTPSIGYILDNLPNLRHLNLGSCFVEDITDVFIVPGQEYSRKVRKTYPSLTEISLSQLYVSKPNEKAALRAAFDAQMFPHLTMIKQERARIFQPHLRRMIPEEAVSVPIHRIFQIRLNSLVYVSLLSFDTNMARLIGANCPNIRNLDLDLSIDINVPYVNSFRAAFAKLSRYLPNLIQLHVCLNTQSSLDITFDSLFFRNMINERNHSGLLSNTPSIPKGHVLAHSIDFHWKNLRGLTLACWKGYTPMIFIALVQFKHLEHLNIYMCSLDDIEHYASLIIKDYPEQNNNNNGERGRLSTKMSPFLELKTVGFPFTKRLTPTSNQCRALVSLVDTTTVIKIQAFRRDQNQWIRTSESYPGIKWCF